MLRFGGFRAKAIWLRVRRMWTLLYSGTDDTGLRGNVKIMLFYYID